MTSEYSAEQQFRDEVAEHLREPVGPVVWCAHDKGGSVWMFPDRPQGPDEEGQFESSISMVPLLDKRVVEALGLAPGACQRFRLVPEGETP